ncbi:MAG: hypothetical protein M3464_19845 [Chloroflexota bacterium]|nr:hypothetical protein [Chloroflexota bacterium]
MTLHQNRPVVVLPSLLFILSLIAIGAAGVGAQANPWSSPDAQYTPLLPSVLSPPRWFLGADEQVHLVYELLLTNASSVPVEVTTVEVLDSDTGRVVATLTEAPLAAAMSLLPIPLRRRSRSQLGRWASSGSMSPSPIRSNSRLPSSIA